MKVYPISSFLTVLNYGVFYLPGLLTSYINIIVGVSKHS